MSRRSDTGVEWLLLAAIYAFCWIFILAWKAIYGYTKDGLLATGGVLLLGLVVFGYVR